MRVWPVLLTALWLGACAAPDSSPDSVSPDEQARQQQRLQNIEAWHLQGRVAIINGSEAWHLNVDWRQQADDYRIDLWGPFGSGRVRLQGDGQGVRLIDGQQQSYYASDPESLLYERTGVKMPISGLRYWILGLADPRYQRDDTRHDTAGRLAMVQQQNWQVEFSRYNRIGDLDLPAKLSVDKHDLRVKLVVDDWQVGNVGP